MSRLSRTLVTLPLATLSLAVVTSTVATAATPSPSVSPSVSPTLATPRPTAKPTPKPTPRSAIRPATTRPRAAVPVPTTGGAEVGTAFVAGGLLVALGSASLLAPGARRRRRDA